MTLEPKGPREGTTPDLETGVALIWDHKGDLASRIRGDILDWLDGHPTWHRNDLRIPVPKASLNSVGAVVSGLVSSGLIEETGERRKSNDPASHSRKSNVYKLKEPGVVNPLLTPPAGTAEPGAANEPRKEQDPAGGAHNSLAPSADPLPLFELPVDTSHYGSEAA